MFKYIKQDIVLLSYAKYTKHYFNLVLMLCWVLCSNPYLSGFILVRISETYFYWLTLLQKVSLSEIVDRKVGVQSKICGESIARSACTYIRAGRSCSTLSAKWSQYKVFFSLGNSPCLRTFRRNISVYFCTGRIPGLCCFRIQCRFKIGLHRMYRLILDLLFYLHGTYLFMYSS